jgi:hypothetical protein
VAQRVEDGLQDVPPHRRDHRPGGVELRARTNRVPVLKAAGRVTPTKSRIALNVGWMTFDQAVETAVPMDVRITEDVVHHSLNADRRCPTHRYTIADRSGR